MNILVAGRWRGRCGRSGAWAERERRSEVVSKEAKGVECRWCVTEAGEPAVVSGSRGGHGWKECSAKYEMGTARHNVGR